MNGSRPAQHRVRSPRGSDPPRDPRAADQGDARVAELAAPFNISQPAVSKHLKVLEEAGLISRHREATARLSHLEAAPLREATQWLVSYHEYWDESFQRLDALLVSLQRSKSGWMPAKDEKGTK